MCDTVILEREFFYMIIIVRMTAFDGVKGFDSSLHTHTLDIFNSHENSKLLHQVGLKLSSMLHWSNNHSTTQLRV